MYCLNSKTYYIWGEVDKDGKPKPKCSSKGANQERNELTREDFKDVVTTQEPCKVENAGFIRSKEDGSIKTYTQSKIGMSYIYMKGKVLADGVSTTHLDI